MSLPSKSRVNSMKSSEMNNSNQNVCCNHRATNSDKNELIVSHHRPSRESLFCFIYSSKTRTE